MNCCQIRIEGVTVWIGSELTGGHYEGAVKVGTIRFQKKKGPYVFSRIEKTASSVQIQGGLQNEVLSLAEVEVYG